MSSSGQELANASKAGDLNRVTRILHCQPGPSILDAMSVDGSTALTQAAEMGHLEIVKLLVQTGADKDKGGQYAYTALMWAAYKGHLEVVNYLVQEAGTDKNKEENMGHTALILATMSGHLDVVKFLVEAGADKEHEDKDGRTALMHAASCGHLQVVKYLVQAGAGTERKNKSKKTALDLAMTEAIKTVIRNAPLPLHTDLTGVSVPRILEGCERVLQYIRDAPQRGDLLNKMLLLHEELEAAVAFEDFESVACHCTQLQALQQQSTQLPLSEEDYLTLPARHADLVQRVTEKCKQLAAAKDFTAVTALGAKLSELHAAAVSPPDFRVEMKRALAVTAKFGDEAASTVSIQLCTAMLTDVANAPKRGDLIKKASALQAQYDAALAAATDFVLVGTLGTQLLALEQQSAQLPLSEEDYLTLGDRHADLVQRVTDTCRELMRARDYAALGPLSAKLKELKALDLTGITGTGAEVQDGADDPVVVRNRAEAASGGQKDQDSRRRLAEEDGDEGGADDPVIVVSSSCRD